MAWKFLKQLANFSIQLGSFAIENKVNPNGANLSIIGMLSPK